MSMTESRTYDEDTSLERLETVAVEVAGGMAGALAKSEVEAQLDAAHRYPRSVKRFLNEATTLATFSREIASSCMYALPRGGKVIEGPSVRLAEICISAYGNLHVGSRVVGAEDKEVVSQGVCWDLEKNNRVTIEKRRKITDKKGTRFNDDMINVTGNAAASIALRDAAFRIIPRTYVNIVYEAARKVAVGEASTLAARRAEVFGKLVKMGAMPDRILARIGKASLEDIGLGELQVLIGFGTAIHSGSEKVDDIFPAVTQERGKVDIESLKAGKEENRGHHNEGLDKLKTEKVETLEQKRQRAAAESGTNGPIPETNGPIPETTSANSEMAGAPDPESPLTDAQHAELEIGRTRNSVETKVWLAWAKKTFGVKMVSQLRQKHFGRALAWTNAGGTEQGDEKE
jgi:hypothetical protein